MTIRIRPREEGITANADIPSEWTPTLEKVFRFLGRLKKIHPWLRWDIRVGPVEIDVAVEISFRDAENSKQAVAVRVMNWLTTDIAAPLAKAIVQTIYAKATVCCPPEESGWRSALSSLILTLAIFQKIFPICQRFTISTDRGCTHDPRGGPPGPHFAFFAVKLIGPAQSVTSLVDIAHEQNQPAIIPVLTCYLLDHASQPLLETES